MLLGPSQSTQGPAEPSPAEVLGPVSLTPPESPRDPPLASAASSADDGDRRAARSAALGGATSVRVVNRWAAHPVRALDLSSSSLRGGLVPGVAVLTTLTVLVLDDNRLSGGAILTGGGDAPTATLKKAHSMTRGRGPSWRQPRSARSPPQTVARTKPLHRPSAGRTSKPNKRLLHDSCFMLQLQSSLALAIMYLL